MCFLTVPRIKKIWRMGTAGEQGKGGRERFPGSGRSSGRDLATWKEMRMGILWRNGKIQNFIPPKQFCWRPDLCKRIWARPLYHFGFFFFFTGLGCDLVIFLLLSTLNSFWLPPWVSKEKGVGAKFMAVVQTLAVCCYHLHELWSVLSTQVWRTSSRFASWGWCLSKWATPKDFQKFWMHSQVFYLNVACEQSLRSFSI